MDLACVHPGTLRPPGDLRPAGTPVAVDGKITRPPANWGLGTSRVFVAVDGVITHS